MNDLLTALFVCACVAGAGGIVVITQKNENGIVANFALITAVSAAVIGFGIMVMALLGMLIIISQTLTGM